MFHYVEGFNEGWIYWDDDDKNNANSYAGTLPDGEYGKDTKIFYCCRSDGFAANAIYLPTSSPFVLLQRGLQYQYVHGMNAVGGHLGIFWVGMCRPGPPNWHPVLEKISPKIDTPF